MRETSGRGVGTLQGDVLFPQSKNLSHFSLAFPHPLFFATVVLHLSLSICLIYDLCSYPTPALWPLTYSSILYIDHNLMSPQNGLHTKTNWPTILRTLSHRFYGVRAMFSFCRKFRVGLEPHLKSLYLISLYLITWEKDRGWFRC